MNFRKIFLVIIIELVIIFGLLFWLSQWKKTDSSQKNYDKPIRKNSTNISPPKHEGFFLEIPSINIKAPIIADVPGDNQTTYLAALQKGIAQYKGTAKPGENGNIFIFGHSSYYFWDKGLFKEIFRPLKKLESGDEIIIWWKSKEYHYFVKEKKIIEPTDLTVTKKTNHEQLTLMTCDPPGTAIKRLVIIAEPKN